MTGHGPVAAADLQEAVIAVRLALKALDRGDLEVWDFAKKVADITFASESLLIRKESLPTIYSRGGDIDNGSSGKDGAVNQHPLVMPSPSHIGADASPAARATDLVGDLVPPSTDVDEFIVWLQAEAANRLHGSSLILHREARMIWEATGGDRQWADNALEATACASLRKKIFVPGSCLLGVIKKQDAAELAKDAPHYREERKRLEAAREERQQRREARRERRARQHG